MTRDAWQKGLGGFIALAVAGGWSGVASAQQLQRSGIEQIQTILNEKGRLTPAQRKLDSHLHFAAQYQRGALSLETIPALPRISRGMKRDEQGNVNVDIKGTVSEALLVRIVALGGKVESVSPQHGAIRAWIPLLSAETLAERPDVNFIMPASKAHYNTQLAPSLVLRSAQLPLAVRQAMARRQLEGRFPGLASALASLRAASPPTAPVDTDAVISEGDNLVQAENIIGTGVKVGVLSDGVTSLATLQAEGDLPANVTVLSGQAGPSGADEGTAMLEIVYDLAPGAQLYFASADASEAQFATNIEALAAAGCTVIVDDVTYFDEGPFQDGTIAQAVDAVVANGVLYFSSAANSGNLDSGTSGTWEGDFNGTGATIPILNTDEGTTVTVHKFNASDEFDTVTAASSDDSPTTLQWGDPLVDPCDDYDLFIMNPALTVVEDYSVNTQDCEAGQEPFEVTSAAPAAGEVVVVVLYMGTTKALHVATNRGELAINTNGATFGHNAGASTLTVAATPVQTTIFTSGNQSPEPYSSDGPRKIFYNPNGTAITTGNVLFGTNGGTTLPKVDFTTGDCGQSAVPDFSPFCGTSAAAPTAASVAALMLSANPSLTRAQVISEMKSTALPAAAGFSTNTVGSGIVMANLAVNSIVVPAVGLTPGSASFGLQAEGTTSGTISVKLANTGSGPLTVNSIQLSGANSGDFGLSQSCVGSLPAGSNCPLNVTFAPTAGGPRHTGLVITDNAAGSPHTVILTGVGTSASLSTSSLTFNAQSVGTPSAAQTVTLTNMSTVGMNVWEIAILGANPGDFNITSNGCGATLGAGLGCSVSVSFKPTATGTRTASLLFSDNGGGSPQSVLLTGTGQ